VNTDATAHDLGLRKLVAWVQSLVGALVDDDSQPAAVDAGGAEFPTVRAARLFAQALRQNSSLDLDWLWYAANMTRDLERRYCLQRALELNPNNELARRALARLLARTSVTREIVPAARPAQAARLERW
jgi:hypothetical protein